MIIKNTTVIMMIWLATFYIPSALIYLQTYIHTFLNKKPQVAAMNIVIVQY